MARQPNVLGTTREPSKSQIVKMGCHQCVADPGWPPRVRGEVKSTRMGTEVDTNFEQREQKETNIDKPTKAMIATMTTEAWILTN